MFFLVAFTQVFLFKCLVLIQSTNCKHLLYTGRLDDLKPWISREMILFQRQTIPFWVSYSSVILDSSSPFWVLSSIFFQFFFPPECGLVSFSVILSVIHGLMTIQFLKSVYSVFTVFNFIFYRLPHTFFIIPLISWQLFFYYYYYF